eukprot:8234250-Pyramimonas_sp.AAC.1
MVASGVQEGCRRPRGLDDGHPEILVAAVSHEHAAQERERGGSDRRRLSRRILRSVRVDHWPVGHSSRNMDV